ncbi:DEAD/DEAH box helicase family protein [Microbacterium sp. ZOR0019]|uniref:DEAD/DEAH box helicase family protein n=1 Tax=Microbacterium sp. ZOR0019 TaxID=1339233 RepID=UPI00068B5E02|nr:DEAD/DEAH box helicase family protein [Microbacterium sp. ZOR0019]
MDTQRTWLTPDEASKYLSLGRTKLYELAQTGKIPAQKIDKQWRFNTTELDSWLSVSKTIGGYFQTVEANIVDNQLLREPQKEAYKKLYDFFKADPKDKVALVQLPVGCGKSGLVSIAPLGIAAGRVLVITPNLTIRNELKNNLDITNLKCFWRRTNVLRKVDMVSGPYVTTLDTGNVTVTDESHFVVTNVQQLSTNTDKWLNKFPSDYFDMIIVDEAHHSAADSWQKVHDHFPEAKVINLTATPFRSDAKEVGGERLYRYPFRSAVTKGYIKRLTAVYVSPREIELTFKGESERTTLTLDEVMKLRDKEWFSRGIAMSDECNKSIVDNSLEKLEHLRNESSIKHQIVAVAMSIPHAKKIQLFYEERGYEAAVIHSGLTEDEQSDVMKRLRSNELDVVVNVQILGEGFDHPQLSVAAIFRPYRTLAPYLQFVGRIMRVNVQNAPRDPDNYGFIVTHAGMNLDALVDDFKLFEKDDEEFWAQINGGLEQEPPLPRGAGGGRRAIRAPLVVHGEIADSLYEEEFVDDEEERLEELRGQLEALGYDASYADTIIQAKRQVDAGMTSAVDPLAVQPQKELERLRKQLDIEIRAKAKTVLTNASLSIAGRDIPTRLMPEISAANNLVAVLVMLNRNIKSRVNDHPRDDWSRDDYTKALELLPGVAIEMVRQLIAAKESKNAKR